MLYDRPELTFKTRRNYLRYLSVIAVPVHRSVPAEPLELFLRAFEERGERALRYRSDVFYHFRYHLRISDNNFLRLIVAEIEKFFDHLVRRAEIERGLLLLVVIALSDLKYLAEYRVFLVLEMRVGCRHNGYPELVAKVAYPLVYLAELKLAVHNALVDKEAVVAYRLYFKIIVERGYLFDLILGFLLFYRLK